MARISLLPLLALFALALSAHSLVLPAANSVADSKFGFVQDDTKYTDIQYAVEDSVDELLNQTDDDLVDDSDEEVIDEATDVEAEGDEMTGFPIEDLDENELEALMDVEDEILEGQAVVHVAKKLFLEAEGLYTKGTGPLRRKRQVGPLVRVALRVGRTLFRNVRRGKVSRSGSRITRQYHKPGTYQDALADFERLSPSEVRAIGSGRISGRTGLMGNHRVTVRDGSSGNSRPTLEIRSHDGKLVRKFRYEQ